jgi:hypothetical protein
MSVSTGPARTAGEAWVALPTGCNCHVAGKSSVTGQLGATCRGATTIGGASSSKSDGIDLVPA